MDDTALTPGFITGLILGADVKVLVFSLEECRVMAESAQLQIPNLETQMAALGNKRPLRSEF